MNAETQTQPAVEFDAIPNETDAFTVWLMKGTDPRAGRLKIGTIKRIGAAEWQMEVNSGEVEGGGHIISSMRTAVIEGATVADMMDAVRRSTQRIELPAASMTNDGMCAHAGEMFMALNQLAARTQTMPGYMSALASAVAQVVDEDVKRSAGVETAVLSAFNTAVQSDLRGRRRAAAEASKLRSILGQMFMTREEYRACSEDELDEVKH